MEARNNIESIIDYTFRNKNLLETALTHASFAYENKTESNEKLEFFGDSILNFVVAELLYMQKTEDEGQMTVSRASIVSRKPLSAVVDKLGLMRFLKLGEGEKGEKHSIKFRSNLYEAILAAIYLDGGMDHAKKFVYNTLGKDICRSMSDDYKSLLQIYKQAKCNNLKLEYITEAADSEFVSVVKLGGKEIGRGKGKRKKEAEQNAAREAMLKIQP